MGVVELVVVGGFGVGGLGMGLDWGFDASSLTPGSVPGPAALFCLVSLDGEVCGGTCVDSCEGRDVEVTIGAD